MKSYGVAFGVPAVHGKMRDTYTDRNSKAHCSEYPSKVLMLGNNGKPHHSKIIVKTGKSSNGGTKRICV